MKTSLTFLLMLFAVTALAANPAFQDFNTNQFGVAGNKVVFKSGALLTNPVVSSGALTGNLSGGTNLPGSGLQASSVNSNRFDAATLAMFGGGDQVWTNVDGVIQPSGIGENTNRIAILPDGTVRVGNEDSSSWTGLTMQGDYTDFTPGNSVGMYAEQRSDEGATLTSVQLFTYADNSPYRQAALYLRSGGGGQNKIEIDSFEDGASIVGRVANADRFSLRPAASASTTPYLFGTSLAHTSGNLLEVPNVTTNKFTVGWDGRVTAAGYVNPTNGILWQGGAQLTNIYTATATLDFGNVATIGCADLTITVTGAALGDVVDLGVPNASVVANSSYSAWVSAADTVTVRFCALISGDPASGVFRAEVHKWK